MLSIVIPLHNEEPSLLPLYDRLTAVLESLQKQYEILFVDDASTDRSFELLANLVETDERLKVIRLRRNFGQTAALSAGFHEAEGSVIIAMDGDLQHAPEDIPALMAKIDEGYDIASGWRKQRVDNAITRKIPSRIANWLMAKASGIELRDFGTTFKAYRSEVLKDVNLYGELHRFIPALASFYGARVIEVPIRNVPRATGDSHYGIGRTCRVLFDILTIKFLLKYFTRHIRCQWRGHATLRPAVWRRLAFNRAPQTPCQPSGGCGTRPRRVHRRRGGRFDRSEPCGCPGRGNKISQIPPRPRDSLRTRIG